MVPRPNDAPVQWSTVFWRGKPAFRLASRGTFADNSGAQSEDPVARAYQRGKLDHVAALLALAEARLRPGDRALDLGAHLGGFALFAAWLGCRVVAVEASPGNAELVRRSAEANGFANLKVVQAAVHHEKAELEFCSLGPFGRVKTAAPGGPAVRVPAIAVDDLLAELGWETAEWVKLDVEGSEVRALRGMRKLLSGPGAPPLYVESNRHTLAFFGETPEALLAELHGLGYRVYAPGSSSGPLRLVPAGHRQQETVEDYLATKGAAPFAPRLPRESLFARCRRLLRRLVDRFAARPAA
jgi:FkbM family methyltransferase